MSATRIFLSAGTVGVGGTIAAVQGYAWENYAFSAVVFFAAAIICDLGGRRRG